MTFFAGILFAATVFGWFWIHHLLNELDKQKRDRAVLESRLEYAHTVIAKQLVELMQYREMHGQEEDGEQGESEGGIEFHGIN